MISGRISNENQVAGTQIAGGNDRVHEAVANNKADDIVEDGG